MAEGIYGKGPPPVVEECRELGLIIRIAQENARYLATGRENPKREDDVETLMAMYEHKPEFRAHVLWALGEMRCSEAAVMIIPIARNWERHVETDGELVEAAVRALGNIDAPGQSVFILQRIAETVSAPEWLRERAAISAEKVAARRGGEELCRVRIALDLCGARQLPGVQRWIERNKPERKPPMKIILQQGGKC
jgi:hypothetical protein